MAVNRQFYRQATKACGAVKLDVRNVGNDASSPAGAQALFRSAHLEGNPLERLEAAEEFVDVDGDQPPPVGTRHAHASTGRSTSSPPRYGRSPAGTTTEPSACWWFSRSATSHRVVASVPLSGPDWTDLPELKPENVDFDEFIGAYDLHAYFAGFDWHSGGGYPPRSLSFLPLRLTTCSYVTPS